MRTNLREIGAARSGSTGSSAAAGDTQRSVTRPAAMHQPAADREGVCQPAQAPQARRNDRHHQEGGRDSKQSNEERVQEQIPLQVLVLSVRHIAQRPAVYV